LGAGKTYASRSVVLFNGGTNLSALEVLDDLDARDKNNQSILTKKAKDGLTEIFRTGLFNLLTSAELYSAAQTLALLSKALNLAAMNLTRDLPATVNNLIAVFLPTIKQLQKILVCLSGLFGLGLLVFSLSLNTYRLSLSSLNFAPVVLRC